MAGNRQETVIAGPRDVEERLPKGPARVMTTVDRLVDCKLTFTRLVTGSLHPAAAALLQVLASEKRPWTLSELSTAIGARGEVGLRFTAELVARLCHAEQLTASDATRSSFVLRQNVQEFARPRTEVLTRTLSYVPRMSWLAYEVPNSHRANFPKYEPPDENALYDTSALIVEVERAGRDYAANPRNFLSSKSRAGGDEQLERNRLLLRTPKIVDTVVNEVRPSNYAIAHRCFFSDTDGPDPWVLVFRAREPRKEFRYTDYFARMIKQNPEFLTWMRSNSQPLARRPQ